MDSQILFLLFIIAFAILSGIGKKRQQAERQRQQPPTDEGEDGAPTRSRERAQAAERETAEAARRERVRTSPWERPEAPARKRAEDAPRARRTEQSSEELIPGDIWEEILGVARGGKPPPKPAGQPLPSRTPPPPEAREEEEPPRKATRPEPVPKWAPRPAAPAPLQPVLPTPRPPRRIREELFAAKSPRALRKAVVLREVLGPPAALKD